MQIPKWADRLFKKTFAPVRCSRCNGLLYKDSERAAGISKACTKKNAIHEAQQRDETRVSKFFYTIPHSNKPSPYFNTLEECAAEADKRVDSKLWSGTYDAPIGFDCPGEK